MNYKEKIISYLKNTEGNLWAEWTESTAPMSELDAIAEESLNRNNPEGMIAALFIYHQLTIEILKSLIIYSNFLIKISVYPTTFTPKEKYNDIKYSEAILQLKYSIGFKGKEKIIENSQKINTLRNEFGHKIMYYWSYSDITEKLRDIKSIFDEVIQTWGICLTDLKIKIEKAKQRDEIQRLIN